MVNTALDIQKLIVEAIYVEAIYVKSRLDILHRINRYMEILRSYMQISVNLPH